MNSTVEVRGEQENLKKTIFFDEESLNLKIDEQAKLAEGNASLEVRANLARKMNLLKELIEANKSLLEKTTGVVKKNVAHSEGKLIFAKLATGLSKGLKLTVNTPADKFWKLFDQTIRIRNLNLEQTCQLPDGLIQDHPQGYIWFENVVIKNFQDLTPETQKQEFINKFVSPSWRTERHQELFNLNYNKTDTVKSFFAKVEEKIFRKQHII
ncbi:hypothetical protein ROZALSC1DRAFT_29514 [Rozella allomycis CSF55]|uniref:Uncharacterized protein n=1 Tax=Rozella allomycis (strain CSF55) TaxID=988480 RepID=A0A075AYN8_ROZAC|nr:hypothetical protein O9G_005609 [Rozella allomycis CSF55]RKP18834.1 hypothetical protein ROZALSC1DRAFT_29514 [Rozella allomycis CSF55]|eukprot:EPZ33832.1 hypothetical protein O9G_005609 [Rozella allomycis CSF55]